MFGLVVAALLLLLVLPAQLRRRPIIVRQLLVLPILAMGLGIVVLALERPTLTQAQLFYFGAQTLLALATGIARGFVVEVTDRRQFAVRRGGWLLVVAWIITIAARLGIDVWVRTFASGTSIAATFPLFLGLTLAAQNALLAWRVRRIGLRFVPRELVQRWRRHLRQPRR